MYLDINSRFALDVRASYHEYLVVKSQTISGNGIDLRKGMEAATSLYHFGEHLAIYLQKDFNTDLRQEINAICADYSILASVVNVHKHSLINRGKPQVTSSEHIKEVVYLIEYKDNKGRYYHAEKGIQINLIDGTTRNLLDIMTNVLNMWYRILYKYGILSEVASYTYNRSVIHPRVTENGAARMDLQGTSGLGMQYNCILERYNYKTGFVEPYPLEDSFPMALQDTKTKEHVKVNVPLTIEEKREFNKLVDDQHKKTFVYDIARKKGMTDELYRLADDKWGEGAGRDFYIEISKGEEKIKRKIIFSNLEVEQYDHFNNEEERQAFLLKIAKERGVYNEIIDEAKEKWPSESLKINQ